MDAGDVALPQKFPPTAVIGVPAAHCEGATSGLMANAATSRSALSNGGVLVAPFESVRDVVAYQGTTLVARGRAALAVSPNRTMMGGHGRAAE